MKDYTFLKRAADRGEAGRPVLTWGHVREIDGEQVVWTADGYRIHMVWGSSIAVSDKHLQFPFSVEGGAIAKAPDISKTLEACKPDTTLCFDTWNFRFAVKAIAGYGAAQMIILGTNLVYLTTEDAMMVLRLANRQMPDISEPLILNFLPKLLLEAIDKKSDLTTVALNSQDLSTPYRVGEYGKRCAIIMPMSYGMNHNFMTQKVLQLERETVQS